MVFVLEQKAIDNILPNIKNKLLGDCIIWFCCPKKSSRKYKGSIDRDHGWEILSEYGFETMRQISIYEDFSALRFRKVEYIKNINRNENMALKMEAKKHTNK